MLSSMDVECEMERNSTEGTKQLQDCDKVLQISIIFPGYIAENDTGIGARNEVKLRDQKVQRHKAP